jgi:hypothetical protein
LILIPVFSSSLFSSLFDIHPCHLLTLIWVLFILIVVLFSSASKSCLHIYPATIVSLNLVLSPSSSQPLLHPHSSPLSFFILALSSCSSKSFLHFRSGPFFIHINIIPLPFSSFLSILILLLSSSPS